ncbi:MAG: hypothetical protein ACJ77K_01630 [Bacteroidia bacterium]
MLKKGLFVEKRGAFTPISKGFRGLYTLKVLFLREINVMKTKEDDRIKPGEIYTVTAEGSLGLLALGAVGIKAWRAKREEEEKKNKEKKNNG